MAELWFAHSANDYTFRCIMLFALAERLYDGARTQENQGQQDVCDYLAMVGVVVKQMAVEQQRVAANTSTTG